MNRATANVVWRWALWLALLVLCTLVLRALRTEIDQTHVVLTYLLLILGGSASGGRAVGVTMSCIAFVLIDYYFQTPYDLLTINKPLDLMALIAFLATALVAAQLLARARAKAEESQRRAVEIASLARLGSETLSAGRAEDALVRMADVIQATLGVTECTIFPWSAGTGFRGRITREGIAPADPAPDDQVTRVVDRGAPLTLGPAEAVEWPAGDLGETLAEIGTGVRTLLLPVRVQSHVVGVLRISDVKPLRLDAEQRRFLAALLYYVALGVERVRLVAEAEHAEALREADRLKDHLLASVSHDLRTPLTTIKALAQGAALRGDAAAAAIEEQTDRLARLVTDLLDLSRFKANGFAATPEINTAEDLIGAAIRQSQGLLRGRSLRAVVDLQSPALVGSFDFMHSLRILGNLIENAVRFSPADQAVELSARREGDALVIAVADRGPGVPAADVGSIFEPFYQAANARPDAGHHAGLGLSIARRLAEIQGGSLAYESRTGGGAVFVLRLPAVELDEASLRDAG